MVTGKPKSAYTMRDIDSDDDDMEADAFVLESEERVRSGPLLLMLQLTSDIVVVSQLKNCSERGYAGPRGRTSSRGGKASTQEGEATFGWLGLLKCGKKDIPQKTLNSCIISAKSVVSADGGFSVKHFWLGAYSLLLSLHNF